MDLKPGNVGYYARVSGFSKKKGASLWMKDPL